MVEPTKKKFITNFGDKFNKQPNVSFLPDIIHSIKFLKTKGTHVKHLFTNKTRITTFIKAKLLNGRINEH